MNEIWRMRMWLAFRTCNRFGERLPGRFVPGWRLQMEWLSHGDLQ